MDHGDADSDQLEKKQSRETGDIMNRLSALRRRNRVGIYSRLVDCQGFSPSQSGSGGFRISEPKTNWSQDRPQRGRHPLSVHVEISGFPGRFLWTTSDSGQICPCCPRFQAVYPSIATRGGRGHRRDVERSGAASRGRSSWESATLVVDTRCIAGADHPVSLPLCGCSGDQRERIGERLTKAKRVLHWKPPGNGSDPRPGGKGKRIPRHRRERTSFWCSSSAEAGAPSRSMMLSMRWCPGSVKPTTSILSVTGEVHYEEVAAKIESDGKIPI